MNIGKFIPDIIRHYYQLTTNSCYRELRRLSKMPRYTATETTLFGFPMKIADASSIISGYKEIFVNGHYKFVTSKSKPFIIDCGANVGLSIVFFKKLFPESKILAFEPDPKLYNLLKLNLNHIRHKDVTICQKAIWKEDTTINFMQEGGFSGRITETSEYENQALIEVETVRLSSFLKQPVDFLKIDIEGAEVEVIKECATYLHNVQNIFVEYHSQANKPQLLHELLMVLHNAGFRYQIKEAHTADMPFMARPLIMGMDLQLDIFAFKDAQ